MSKKVPQLALDIIKEFEGFSPTPYLCQAGIRTIGYGTVLAKDIPDRMTPETAEKYLRERCQKDFEAILKLLRYTLSEEQYSALVSFVYNVGLNNFAKSTLLKKINERKIIEVPQQINRWRYVTDPVTKQKIVSMGLAYRRMAEALLFIHNDTKPLSEILKDAREYADKLK